MNQKFTIHERLKSVKDIETLFQKGEAFSVFPIKCIWLLVPRSENDLSPFKIVVNAPKRFFPRAHDRNKIKRALRESWRTNKQHLAIETPSHVQLHLFFMYKGSVNNYNHSNIAHGMKSCIQKLISNIK
jgi:ribonuclease P protein component